MEGWVVVLHEGMESHNTGWVSLQVSNYSQQLLIWSKIVCVCTNGRFCILGIICAPWHFSTGNYRCLCKKTQGKFYKAPSLTVWFNPCDKKADYDDCPIVSQLSQTYFVSSLICLFSQLVDKHLMIQALDRWKVFTELRRKKRRMLQTALELNKLETLQ